MDRELWNLYEAAFTEVGPALTLARLATGDTGWPNYDGNAIICGNLQSVLASAPEHFSMRSGLHVSELTFVDEAGQPVSEATVGARYVAQVRLFSALPFTGTLTGVVQADAPGLSADGEPLGAAWCCSADLGDLMTKQCLSLYLKAQEAIKKIAAFPSLAALAPWASVTSRLTSRRSAVTSATVPPHRAKKSSALFRHTAKC